MDANRLTDKARQGLAEAQALASRLDHQQIEPEHLMLALLDQSDGIAPAVLNKANVDAQALSIQLHRELDKLPKVTGNDHHYASARLNKVLANAESEAKALQDQYVSVEHFLLALAKDNGATGKLFKDFGLTHDKLVEGA